MNTETRHTPGSCGCCVEPVDDKTVPCDLCSEATGTNDGVGWIIRYCPLHAAAPELVAFVKMVDGLDGGVTDANLANTWVLVATAAKSLTVKVKL